MDGFTLTPSPEEIRRRASEAVREAEQSEGGLYRGDGEPKYGETSMRERTREIRDAKNRRLEELEKQAKTEAAAWERRAAAVREPDIAATLTDAEHSRASSMYPFTSEEIATMSDDALRDRVEAVHKVGARSSLFVHARAIRQRAHEEAAKGRPAAAGGGTVPPDAS